MLDQRGPQVQPLERRVYVGDVLRRHDDVVRRHLGGEIADGILERQDIGDSVHVDAEGRQLLMALFRHALLTKAGHDVDAVTA